MGIIGGEISLQLLNGPVEQRFYCTQWNLHQGRNLCLSESFDFFEDKNSMLLLRKFSYGLAYFQPQQGLFSFVGRVRAKGSWVFSEVGFR